MVELELMTSEERVLMEADTTRTSTKAMRMTGRLSSSMAGMMVSNPPEPSSTNNLPNPPRK